LKAVLWLHDEACRVLIYDESGKVIDSNDDWNNRASAEMTVLMSYPSCEMTFIRWTEDEKIKKMNREWEVCILGN
jgi:hypothetical protein